MVNLHHKSFSERSGTNRIGTAGSTTMHFWSQLQISAGGDFFEKNAILRNKFLDIVLFGNPMAAGGIGAVGGGVVGGGG